MPRPRTLPHALLGVAVVVAFRLCADAVEPRADELLALRWMRAAADHPLRSALAFALLARAAASRSGAPGAAPERGEERADREETRGAAMC